MICDRIDNIVFDPLRTALFLDFDGTLVDIAPSPSAVKVPPDLVAVLNKLNHVLSGAFALVTGRSLDDIQDQLDGYVGIVSGSHGAELRWPGSGTTLTSALVSEDLAEMKARVSTFRAAHPHLLAEEKPASITLHYRNDAALAGPVARLADSLAKDFPAFEPMRAKKCIELKLRGVSKAKAIQDLMARPLFKGRNMIFAGDDLTDANAFPMIRAEGGAAISVGTPLNAASHHAATPADFVSWLRKQVFL